MVMAASAARLSGSSSLAFLAAARKAKDFAQADAIRSEVAVRGVELRDGPQGTDWRVLL